MWSSSQGGVDAFGQGAGCVLIRRARRRLQDPLELGLQNADLEVTLATLDECLIMEIMLYYVYF
jgi:hypothetical protein